MTAFWAPVATLWWRDLIRFWREKSRVLGYVGSPLLFWALIGSGFGDLAFFFPGALVLTVMFSAVFSTMSLIEDRREGFLLSMLVSPAPRSAMALGKILGSSTLATIQGAIFLLFAPAAGLTPGLAGLAEAVGVIFLVSFMFTSLGFLIAWQMDSTQGFHAIMNLVLFPLWLVSGSLFSMATAHGWVRWLMRLNPVTYSVSALRHALERETAVDAPSLPTSLAVTVCCAALLLACSTALANRRTARTFA
jgi:ABC-2 type transport system permease protein